MSINKVIIMGNLTRDPDYKNVGQTNLCNFGIAVNRKTKVNGQFKEETTFVDVTAWGKTAENIAKYFTKGKPILIEGRLKLDEWADTQGQKRSKLKVIVEKFHFCGGSQQAAPQAAPQGQNQNTQQPCQGQTGYSHQGQQNYPQQGQTPAKPNSPFV